LLSELQEAAEDSDQLTFPNNQSPEVKRGTAKGKVIHKKRRSRIAGTNQQDWQTCENGLKEDLWTDLHHQRLIATMTRVRKTLPSQQWQSECLGKVFIANGWS
jgi:hypothetical protein